MNTSNPWTSLNRSGKSFVCDIDAVEIDKHALRVKKPEYSLVTCVVPEPWCGPISTASVMVLSGNPRWTDKDEELPPAAHEAMWQNLTGDEPLFWLRGSLVNTTGADWYRQNLLKDVLQECESARVAERLCLVDFIGYRSRNWDSRLRFPSQGYTVQQLKAAMDRRAVIVLTRGQKPWFSLVPELDSYPLLFKNNSWRVVRISERNTSAAGYNAVLDAVNG